MSIIDPVRTRVDLASLDLGFARFPNAQPFSPRSASGYQELLEGLYRYVTKDLYTFLVAASGQATWDNNVDALLAAVDGVLAQQKSDIDSETAAALQTVINSTIPITDPVTLAIVNDATTATRKKLDGLYVGTSTGAKNPFTGMWHADAYGAKYDGSDDRAAVQAAVDAAHADYLAANPIAGIGRPREVYLASMSAIGVANYYDANHAQQGVAGIVLKSGVKIVGPGGLRCLNNQYGTGAQYGLVRGDAAGISDAGLDGITIDGNRSNQTASTQANTVWIRGIANIRIENCKVYNSNGNGIMVVGTFSTPVTDVVIENNRLNGINTIGIQVSQFDGVSIHNNVVESTNDNGIDVYGENQGSTVSNGINFRITDNTLRYNGNGIFPETVAYGEIVGNKIYNSVNHGIHINRINGQPRNINIVGNTINGCPGGIGATGDMRAINIRNNDIDGFTVGGVVLGGAGNVSGINILDNTMNGTSDSIPLLLIRSGTAQTAKIIHLRTVTESKNRTYDTVNSGPAAVSSTWLAALSPGDSPVG